MKRKLFILIPAAIFLCAALAFAGWYDVTGSKALIRGFIDMPEQATAPGTPSADVMRFYVAVDGTTSKFYLKDQVGTAYDVALNGRPATPTTLSATTTVTAGTSVTAGTDITATEDATGGNAGAKSEIQGLPKIDLVSLGTMTNGSTETTLYTDDSPAGEWAPVDADVTESSDTTNYRGGTTSYKAAVAATAAATDGITRSITPDDLEADESIGLWFRTDTALTAGWLTLVLTDDGGARTYNLPAVVTADINKWIWTEIDISDLTGGTGNVVSAVSILLSTAGATGLGAFNFWIDGMFKWDAADEETVGQNLVQDGVLSVLTNVNADAGTQSHEKAKLAEGTDYFIHYQTGNDAIVIMTDQSTKDGIALVAFQ